MFHVIFQIARAKFIVYDIMSVVQSYLVSKSIVSQKKKISGNNMIR